MDFQKLLVSVAKILNKHGIPYAVTGGYAVSIWGRPRATFDIDIVIELFQQQISELADALRSVAKVSYVDENMMLEAIRRRGEFNFIHGDSGMKVDFWMRKGDPFSRMEFQRRVPVKIEGVKVYFVSPEDLILSKLRWYQITPSSRQLEDVESVFKISGKQLDRTYLASWAKKLKVFSLLSPFLKK
ncbi:MAG: nucleotidyltransferase [Candidatus Wildermuthbacteria bacterium]|nr:nucleotidyltransferase [Candidatus Wildermuthbacteria bacterium]